MGKSYAHLRLAPPFKDSCRKFVTGAYSTYHADMADGTKPREPWIDPDSQPGDFDAELDRALPEQIEVHESNPDSTLSVIAGEN